MKLRQKKLSISDIVLQARNGESFFNLLPASELRTEDDVRKASEQGYAVSLTADAFQKKFELTDCELQHIYFSPYFGHAYYWDEATMVVFPLILAGEEYLSPNKKSMRENIAIAKEDIAQKIKERNFYFISYTLNDRMRMEYLKMLIEKNIPGIYKVFLDIYQMSDYGCDIICDNIQALLAAKTEAQKGRTKKALKGLPPVVTLYRGGGDKSTPLSSTISWTRNPAVAVFFATRLTEEGGCLYTAHVKKEDIFECVGDTEAECMVFPGKIGSVEVIELYGVAWLKPALTRIAPSYQRYIASADYCHINFEHKSEIHTELHSRHVLLFALLLADLYDLKNEDVDALAEAALYHDTGRLNDEEDTQHGTYSAKKYEQFHKNPDPVVPFLMRYHCKPDKEGESAIATTPALASQQERANRLFALFKDADALDRLRLGQFELDFTQLRTAQAQKLVLIAALAQDFR